MARTPKPCACGCKEITKGGEFMPGHDMRLKSRLVAEAHAGGNPAAREELERRGWLGALNNSKGRSRPKTIDEFEHGIAHRIDELMVLKAAARRLRASGQYRRNAPFHIELNHLNAVPILAGQLPELRPAVDPFELSPQEREAFERLCKVHT